MAGPQFTTRPLDESTWPAFAELVAAHNGVWGGCWCMSFHPEGTPKGNAASANRDAKLARVRAATAHAALVFAGPECVGWCQYGPPAELPRIKHRKAYQAADPQPPGWRITCFFVGRNHRHQGVAEVALDGALAAIRAAGGGLVEAYPEAVAGRKVSGSFLWNGTLGMYERAGFTAVRKLGKNTWLVTAQL